MTLACGIHQQTVSSTVAINFGSFNPSLSKGEKKQTSQQIYYIFQSRSGEKTPSHIFETSFAEVH